MKHIKDFFTKKKVEEPTEPLVELKVNILGRYKYKGVEYELKKGDYTNFGLILNIETLIDDRGMPTYFKRITTTEGEFSIAHQDVIVYKGDIDLLIQTNKYNL